MATECSRMCTHSTAARLDTQHTLLHAGQGLPHYLTCSLLLVPQFSTACSLGSLPCSPQLLVSGSARMLTAMHSRHQAPGSLTHPGLLTCH